MSTSTQNQTQSAGTESPQEPEVEPDTEFGDYDTNIVQLSDTEEKGIDYEKVIEQYEEGDVDAFVYAGDASKKMADPAAYLGRFEQTYDELSKIQEELDTEVLVEPGNHSPIAGSHTAGGWAGAADDEDYVNQVEDILEAHYEEFTEFEGNAYEFLADEYDLTNIEYDSVDIGDITIVGGTHHDAEMDKIIEKEWLDGEVAEEDLGYAEEDLEEIADDLSGDFFERVLDKISFGYLGRPSKEVEELTLDEIPEEYKTEEHESYEEAKELQNYFEDAIESAENDVFLTHHGIPTSHCERFGSKVVDQVMEDYSEGKLMEDADEELIGVGGGHTGTPSIQDNYGVPTINTNEGAIIELGYDQQELVHAEPSYEEAIPEDSQSSQNEKHSQEVQMQQAAQEIRRMEQAGGPDQYFQEIESDLDQMAQEKGIEDDRLREIKERQKEALEEIWEQKDQVLDQNTSAEGETPA